MEGDTKILPPAASKTKSPARGTKQGPWIFIPELPTLVLSLLTAAPGSLMAAAAAPAQALRGPHCSFLRVLQAQLTLATGQVKGAWKRPVGQWECTTGKDMLEEVSR